MTELESAGRDPRPRRFRVHGLDGVRALAVAAVMAFHIFPAVAPGGYAGVDTFFVVSGYLITTLALREIDGTGHLDLGQFWLRRARRILPAVLTVLLVGSAAAKLVGGDVLVHLRSQVIGALTFTSNWVFVSQGTDYFSDVAPELFRHLWSLAVEEQFYLVWPVAIVLLMRLRRRRRVRWVFVGAVVSALLMLVLRRPYGVDRVYFGTDTHGFGLLFGAFLAFGTHRLATRGARAARLVAALVTVLALVALCSLFVGLGFSDTARLPLGLVLVVLATGALIGSLLVDGNPLGGVLDAGLLGWTGRRSYGLYLWHWPVYVLLAAMLPGERSGAGGLIVGLTAVAVTVVLAELSWRWIETPVRRRGFRTGVRELVGLGRGIGAGWLTVQIAVVVAVTVLAGLALQGSRSQSVAQQNIDRGLRVVEQSQRTHPVPPPTSPGPHPSSRAATPHVTAPISGRDLVLVGDSVTLDAAPEVLASYPGALVDASVGRQFGAVVSALRHLGSAGRLGSVVVVSGGTNGPVTAPQLEQMEGIVGPHRRLVLVNAYAPRPWVAGSNATLSAFCVRQPNCAVADWHAAADSHLSLLTGDRVHFGPQGARLWLATLRAALATTGPRPRRSESEPSAIG